MLNPGFKRISASGDHASLNLSNIKHDGMTRKCCDEIQRLLPSREASKLERRADAKKRIGRMAVADLVAPASFRIFQVKNQNTVVTWHVSADTNRQVQVGQAKTSEIQRSVGKCKQLSIVTTLIA